MKSKQMYFLRIWTTRSELVQRFVAEDEASVAELITAHMDSTAVVTFEVQAEKVYSKETV